MISNVGDLLMCQYVYFEEKSIQVFCLFFDCVIWFFVVVVELCELFGNEVLVIYKYFFSFCRLFVLFIVSFAMHKLVNLIRSHSLVFVFMSIALGD